MTREQKLAALARWQSAIEQSNATIDPIIDLLKLVPESPITEAVWSLHDALTEATSELVGAEFGELAWYSLENGMGSKAFAAGLKDDMRPIQNLEDLLWLIEVVK